jgi:dTDP-4-dehydrorhamnose reductase
VKIFVTGISGLLGVNFAAQVRGSHEVSGAFLRHPIALDDVTAIELDVCDAAALERQLDAVRPDVVLHTAGLTNVDACEDHPDLATRLNVDAARAVAVAARRAGARVAHVSTDQLFDGSAAFVTEETPAAPVNNYGRSKLAAERAVSEVSPDALIVRTNFYGWGTSVRPSFSDWILGALERREPLNMFNDTYFTPILINDLVERIVGLIERRVSGVVNVAGAERLSKHAFARCAADVFGLPADRIVGTPLASMGLRAARPRDMSLHTGKISALLGEAMPGARDGLERLRRLGAQGWPETLERAMMKRPA